MQFLDVKTDFAFKKVFGSEASRHILLSFLNALIYSDSPREITDLTIVDPYTIPMLKGMKDTYVDVKAVLDDNTFVIIEMQVLNHAGFEKRVLYNAAKHYSVQLKKGEHFTLLNPVIALTIVDFKLFPDSNKLINRFKLLEKDNFIKYSDDIELIFIELPKFDKDETQLDNIRDKWIYFVKNAGRLDYIPQPLKSEFKEVFDIVNEANLTEAELYAQYKRHEFIAIQKSSVEFAQQQALEQGLEKGLEQGLEKGLEQGLEEGKQQVWIKNISSARKMGLSLENISDLTGLNEDKIRLLMAENNIQ